MSTGAGSTLLGNYRWGPSIGLIDHLCVLYFRSVAYSLGMICGHVVLVIAGVPFISHHMQIVCILHQDDHFLNVDGINVQNLTVRHIHGMQPETWSTTLSMSSA